MMIQPYYYTALFCLSFLLTLLYAMQWHSHLDDHLTMLFILIPVINLGYMLMYTNQEAETAMSLLKIVYIGGCFLSWLMWMCVMSLCRIRISRTVRMLTLLLNSAIYFSVLTIGQSTLFYKSLTLERVGGAWSQNKEYGPLHTIHYVLIVCYLIADVVGIIYCYRKRKQVSKRILVPLFIPIPLTVIGYIANRWLLQIGYELVPLNYVLAQVVYLLIAHQMVLYNVSEIVIESMVQSGETGFITVDNKGCYLGSNGTARRFLPELRLLMTDQPVRSEAALDDTVTAWLNRFQQDPDDGKFLYSRKDEDGEETIFMIVVNYLYDGSRCCGYQIFLQDDTKHQKYVRLLDQYNSDLRSEVAAKTDRIVAMHDRLVLGMASMVDSRDNSTGGHIRRTSEGVRLLVEAIQEDGELQLSDDFCRNIIKAAPMHDLGKIAVDDAILRKPGRFTPEEYEMMKSHAAEGARIVHEILQDTDDENFRRIAENVAHYHHERMDGSGYPDRLRGNEIPLEARIMAVADVYDALVSKRVYKEEFSFEKADRIILEGMGTQFDPALKKYYETARPKLEAYYSQVE
ncbi:MAG: HD domain-containing protein [Anaerolineaceae bacterium]|nr:HD domain-containing protein [Anaerolineaceae bacterium]